MIDKLSLPEVESSLKEDYHNVEITHRLVRKQDALKPGTVLINIKISLI